jgi:outer membrane protein assembly factor BamB
VPVTVFPGLLGAATVANDVVFTSTYDGTADALDVASGQTLWTATARAGTNSFPAIDGDSLLVGFSARGFVQQPVYELDRGATMAHDWFPQRRLLAAAHEPTLPIAIALEHPDVR